MSILLDILDRTPTFGEVTIALAIAGGYKNRKNDGPPGVICIWRGIRRLKEIEKYLEDMGK